MFLEFLFDPFKNLVAAGLTDKCEVQLVYAIGVARPVTISVDTFGTGVSTASSWLCLFVNILIYVLLGLYRC